MTDTREARLDHRPFEPRDAAALSAVFAECFPHPRPPERWQWLYRDFPGRADSFVLLVDDQIAGFVGSLWFDGWLNGRPIRLNRGADFMIHPSLRGTGYYWEVTRPYTAARRTAEIRFEFPTSVTLRVSRKSDYWMEAAGPMPQFWRWQTGRAVCEDSPRVPRPAAGAAVWLVRTMAGLGSRRRAVVDVDQGDLDTWAPALDALADRSATFAPVVLRHDTAFIRWRWFADPTHEWTVSVLPSEGGAIAGLVAFGMTDGRGEIADVLAEDAVALRTLLAHATDRLAHAGAERIRLLLSDPRPWSRLVLRRSGFLNRGEGPMLSARIRRSLDAPEAYSVTAWHLTFADYG